MTPKQKALYWREWAAVRRVCPEADRHTIHVVAFGRDKSSKHINSRGDFDRILSAFRAISQSSNLNAQVRLENMPRTRALHTINSFPSEYVIAIAVSKYGTRDVYHLSDDQILELAMTLNNRRNAREKHVDESYQSEEGIDDSNAQEPIGDLTGIECPF
jgi:hypothetical protein